MKMKVVGGGREKMRGWHPWQPLPLWVGGWSIPDQAHSE